MSNKLKLFFIQWITEKEFALFTVLGNLYNRDFVVRNNLKFNENFRYYCDMTFMCPLLEKLTSALQVEEAIYVKRKHNDPINEPALSQEENENRFNERCDAVEYTRTLFKTKKGLYVSA